MISITVNQIDLDYKLFNICIYDIYTNLIYDNSVTRCFEIIYLRLIRLLELVKSLTFDD